MSPNQHDERGPRPTRLDTWHIHHSRRMPNGDDYCRDCGMILLCRHGNVPTFDPRRNRRTSDLSQYRNVRGFDRFVR